MSYYIYCAASTESSKHDDTISEIWTKAASIQVPNAVTKTRIRRDTSFTFSQAGEEHTTVVPGPDFPVNVAFFDDSKRDEAQGFYFHLKRKLRDNWKLKTQPPVLCEYLPAEIGDRIFAPVTMQPA